MTDPYKDLPKSVRIGHLEYAIEVMDVELADAQDVYGTFSGTDQVIRVREDLSAQRVIEVLMHEVLHGIYKLFSIGSFTNDKYEIEEEFVDRAGCGLVLFFQMNPDFVTWLTKNLKG